MKYDHTHTTFLEGNCQDFFLERSLIFKNWTVENKKFLDNYQEKLDILDNNTKKKLKTLNDKVIALQTLLGIYDPDGWAGEKTNNAARKKWGEKILKTAKINTNKYKNKDLNNYKGKSIVDIAKEMTDDKDIRDLQKDDIDPSKGKKLKLIKTSCHDWANEVCERAGYKKFKDLYRKTVSKKDATKNEIKNIKAGDRIVIDNGNTFGETRNDKGTHSVIFIKWIEKDGKKYMDTYSFPGRGYPKRQKYPITKNGNNLIRIIQRPEK